VNGTDLNGNTVSELLEASTRYTFHHIQSRKREREGDGKQKESKKEQTNKLLLKFLIENCVVL
jgi:hypothetical protein